MGEEDILTYEELRNIQRKERINRSLQPLEPDFLKKVSSYLDKKKELLQKTIGDGNRFSVDMGNKINNEVSNAQRVLKDIMERRESKIMLQGLMDARAGVPAENVLNMLPLEKGIYKNIFEAISKYRKECFYPLLAGQFVQKELVSDEPLTQAITLLSSVPEFLWKDSNKYGPFDEGDSVEVPLELAKFLLAQKKAVAGKQMEKA